MGEDPAANVSFSCNFYNVTYVTALQDTLLSSVEDYPWVDCATCVANSGPKGCGGVGVPPNLDFNLLTNYAFDALFAAENKRCLVLNRIPGRGDGSNRNEAPLNGSKLQGNIGAHRQVLVRADTAHRLQGASGARCSPDTRHTA
jgi:hypothetical protein